MSDPEMIQLPAGDDHVLFVLRLPWDADERSASHAMGNVIAAVPVSDHWRIGVITLTGDTTLIGLTDAQLAAVGLARKDPSTKASTVVGWSGVTRRKSTSSA